MRFKPLPPVLRALPVVFLLFFGMACNNSIPQADTSQPGNPWNLSWYQYIQTGIREANGNYTAGKVKDIIEVDENSLLAISPTSGVWLVNSGQGIHLSKEWINPDMRCIERGKANQYFAGGQRSDNPGLGALYVNDFATRTPLISRWYPISLSGIGRIHDIAYISQRNLLFLATSNGIWYSSVPANPGGANYNFRLAQMPPGSGAAFENIIRSGANHVIASQNKDGITTTLSGIYFIELDADPNFNASTAPQLIFRASALNNATSNDNRSIFLSPNFNTPQQVVAMVGSARGEIEGIYVSNSNGVSFDRRNSVIRDGNATTPITSFNFFADRDFNWAGSVAVNSNDPNMIVFGGANGPYISVDGGSTFAALRNTGIHQDYGRLLFSSYHPNRLYCATDGGIAYTASYIMDGVTPGTSPVRMSNTFNNRLANLTFLSSTGRRFFYGNLAANSLGWIAGGLQDNDNVIAYSEGQPWEFSSTAGNDGGANTFINAGLFSNDGNNAITAFSPLNGSRLGTATTVNVTNSAPRLTTSVIQGPLCVFNNSSITVAGRQLCGFSGNTEGEGNPRTLNNIYGIYNSGNVVSASYMFSVPFANGEIVSSLYSDNGNKLLIGTRGGARIFLATRNSSNGSYTITTGNLPNRGQWGDEIGKIVSAGNDTYVSIQNQGTGCEVYFSANGSSWNTIKGDLPNGNIFSIAVDTASSLKKYFVAMDNGVYGTSNLNDSRTQWVKISTGLPTIPHSSDLLIYTKPDGNRRLFLSTFGTGVWVTDLPR